MIAAIQPHVIFSIVVVWLFLGLLFGPAIGRYLRGWPQDDTDPLNSRPDRLPGAVRVKRVPPRSPARHTRRRPSDPPTSPRGAK